MKLPDDIEALKIIVTEVLYPICSAVGGTKAEKNFLFTAKRTDAGRNLPPFYLCYFLFVDLLGFKNLGKFEKIAWSVPINYKGRAYLLEHRKFGLGIFASDKENQEAEVREIVNKITRAVKIAQPYFEWRAIEAAKRSDLNVLNHSRRLFDRLEYFLGCYKNKQQEADDHKGEKIVTKYPSGGKVYLLPEYELRRNSEWLAISSIEAFFSWTEHIFIHATILQGKITTGEEVANLADDEWPTKFKSALDISNSEIKVIYDQLVVIKRQIRNYLAHGAFGKRGEAFKIHTGAGAVPLMMPHQKGSPRFTLHSDLGFDAKDAINVIVKFIELYWKSDEYPEVIYVQSDLPAILPYATDGTYESAMSSVEEMKVFVDYLAEKHDRAANMDW